MKRFVAILMLLIFTIGAGVVQQQVSAAAVLPCDIYAAANTPCVAAHSTTRALYAAYSGRLYQVKRTSDNATTNITTLSVGSYASAAAQDAFCAGTTCTITIIYDQSSNHNDLHISPAGGAGGADVGANAAALPAIAGGNKVYGVFVAPGVGYRDLAATGTAKNGQPEGMYMVSSGTHVNGGCCFDYGNTEQPLANDTGNGHMDAVYFGLRCEHPPCTGSGPWIAADLENGLFQGNGSNTGDMTVTYNLVTAMLKNNGQTTFALKTANAQSGGLTTQYSGTLPNGSFTGYIPMHQEGGIVLGVGGDNSNGSAGSFFEGVMTSGYPTDAAENSVQSNIVSVGYTVSTYSTVVPTSETTAQSWKYTTTTPAIGWQNTSFSDSAWKTGNGGFGTAGTPGCVIGTTWSTADIWVRRHFNPGSLTTTQISNLAFRLHHDEAIDVYINGVAAFSASGFISGYEYDPIASAAQNAIVVNGDNVLAFHAHQTTGGQCGDVGVSVSNPLNFPSASYIAVAPTSETTAQSWKYTTTTPASGWQNTSFSDSAWNTGNGGFGTAGTPGCVIGTTWSTADIWARRHFNPGTLTAAQIGNLVLRLHHDEDIDVYINGVAAFSAPGFISGYEYDLMASAAQNAVVVNGDNVLAFHVHQTTGGQCGDVGVYDYVSSSGNPTTTPTFQPPTNTPVVTNTPTPTPIPVNPIAWWTFDATSGTTAADSSGNNHTGTLQGSPLPVWTSGCHSNGCLTFNGTNDDVDINGAVVTTSGSFTVSAWVNLSTLNGWNTAVSQDGTNISGFYLQYGQALGNKFGFAFLSSDSTAAAATRAVSVTSPTTGTWYHIVGVRNASTNTIAIYVNGTLENSVSFSNAWSASGHTEIGRAKWGSSTDWFNGKIDEVRIYNSALTTAQIAAIP